MVTTTTLRAYLADLADLLAAGASTKVITHCRHILRHFPQNVDAYRLLAQALYDRGQHDDVDTHYEQAFDLFQRVLSVLPNDVTAHKYVALIFQRREQVDRAIWHFERAFEQSPSDRDIQHHLRQLYTQQVGAPQTTRVHLTRGALARQHIAAGLLDQALIELRSALEEFPDRVDLKVLLAETLWETQHQVEAGELAAEILEKLPYCLSANRILARLWLDNERPTDAQAFLDRIESLNPYAARGVLRVDTGVPDTMVLDRLDYDVQSQVVLSSETPTWLTDLDAMSDSSQGEVGPFAGIGAEWFTEAAADAAASSLPATPKEAASEDTFADWLSEIGRADDQPDEPDQDSVAHDVFGRAGSDDQSVLPDEAGDPGQMPDWLRSLPVSDAQPLGDGDTHEFSVDNAFDAWLADVGEDVGVASDDTANLQPDWFPGSALHSAVETHVSGDDMRDPGVVDPDVAIGSEVPDWLSGALDTGMADAGEISEEHEARLPGDVTQSAERSDESDDAASLASWLSGSDDAPVDDLDSDSAALSNAFAELLDDELAQRVPYTTEPLDENGYSAPDWLSETTTSENLWPAEDTEFEQIVGRDESSLWPDDEGSDWLTELDGELSAPDSGVQSEPYDGETDDSRDLPMSTVEPEDEQLSASVDDGTTARLLSEVPELMIDPVPLEDDISADDSEAEAEWRLEALLDGLAADEPLDRVFAGTTQSEESAAKRSDVQPNDSEDELGWLRASDAEQDWLASLSAADTADVLDMVDSHADGFRDDLTDDTSLEETGRDVLRERHEMAQSPDEIVDISVSDDVAYDTSLTADDGYDAETPEDDVAESVMDTGSDQAFASAVTDEGGLHEALHAGDSLADAEEEAEDVSADVNEADEGPAWLRGLEIDAVRTADDTDEPAAFVQQYEPFDEGTADNVAHYGSARHTGILQPDELPAWMTAFTGEDMDVEFDDENIPEFAEPEGAGESDVEDELQGEVVPALTADEERDEVDEPASTDGGETVHARVEDVAKDADTTDALEGLPAWLLAIAESEADKLDRSLFESSQADSLTPEEHGVQLADIEADWLYDIADSEQEPSPDDVRRDSGSAIDLNAVTFDDAHTGENVPDDVFAADEAEQEAGWDIEEDTSDTMGFVLDAVGDTAVEAVSFGEAAGVELEFQADSALDAVLEDSEKAPQPSDSFAELEAPELGQFNFGEDMPDLSRGEPVAEHQDITHTKVVGPDSDESAARDTFDQDDFHLDDIVPVWLRTPKESDLLEDGIGALQDDMPEPEPPEWLRDVVEDDEQTGDSEY